MKNENKKNTKNSEHNERKNEKNFSEKTDMFHLLENFSPEISGDLVGEDLDPEYNFPIRPQKVFDLHGYFQDEIASRVKWIFAFSQERDFSRIKIITGKGRQILFFEVQRILQQKKKEYGVLKFFSDEGSFDIYLSS